MTKLLCDLFLTSRDKYPTYHLHFQKHCKTTQHKTRCPEFDRRKSQDSLELIGTGKDFLKDTDTAQALKP